MLRNEMFWKRKPEPTKPEVRKPSEAIRLNPKDLDAASIAFLACVKSTVMSHIYDLSFDEKYRSNKLAEGLSVSDLEDLAAALVSNHSIDVWRLGFCDISPDDFDCEMHSLRGRYFSYASDHADFEKVLDKYNIASIRNEVVEFSAKKFVELIKTTINSRRYMDKELLDDLLINMEKLYGVK